ncbi:transposase [Candidatus Parcubacteria bacterium]|nr:transposase [Candidatus Parcubacteria bacterium]
MADCFAGKHRIETTRLKGWDYSEPGYYFVTICTRDRVCCLGDIVDGKMRLSEIGEIAHQYWLKIPNHFGNVVLDEFVVMPSHVHGIIVINESDCRDGACPVSTDGIATRPNLGNIVGSFKSAVTRWCHENDRPFAWQSRFYDHIIRNEKSLNQTRQYIDDNPENWETDRNNPEGRIPRKPGSPA